MEYDINVDGHMMPRTLPLNRTELEFISKAREASVKWNDIGVSLGRSGEAIRSCWRRALSRFDDLTSEDNYNDLIALSNRFWSKVDIGYGDVRLAYCMRDSDCWSWKACTNKHGYGKFRIGQTTIVASRMAYILTKGKLKENEYVLHTCNNPLCCNPAHLKAGSQSENMLHFYKGKKGSNDNENSGCNGMGNTSSVSILASDDINALQQT